MDIFEYALEKERLSEQFYRKLADKSSEGLKKILTMLAAEERKHYKVVEQMKNQQSSKITDVDVLGDAKKVFEKMRGSAENFNFDVSQPELYNKARDIELASRKFYLAKSEQSEDETQKRIFRDLAAEENKHFLLIESILDFVSRPQVWLDNAEFTHLEDYADGVF